MSAKNRNIEKIEENRSTTSPVLVFAEKVAIAGLDESYKADFLPDKIMFCVALLTALGMIIFQSIGIARQLGGINTVFTDLETVSIRAPFPNVSICYPATVDENYFRQSLLINEKDERLLKRHNLTDNQVLDYIKEVFSFDLKPSTTRSTVLKKVAKNVYDSFLNETISKGLNALKILSPHCSKILSNCSYNGRKFDCCEAAEILSDGEYMCSQISMKKMFSKYTYLNDNYKDDRMHLESIGLTVEVSTDWTFGRFQDYSASDGFHVFIDVLPFHTQDPVNIPADMDALIVLAQPRRVNEITRCRSENNRLKLDLFDYYDPHGIHCMAETLSQVMFKYTGCQTSTLSYAPVNGSCAFDQFYLFSMLISSINSEHGNNAIGLANMDEKMLKQFDTMRSLFFSDKCLPLCKRWTYRVLSASYGSMQYKSKRNYRSLLSRSRIKVISPHTASWSRKEEVVFSEYLVMCKIAAVMSAYLGISMITFAQILARGSYIVWYFKKKRCASRVHPYE